MSTTNLGAFIRKTRKEKNISVRELARRIHLSAPSLSEIERGKQNPSESTLKRIAEHLGLRVEQLEELDSWSALKYFKELLDEDRELSLAFAGMVRGLKHGKISRKAIAKGISVLL